MVRLILDYILSQILPYLQMLPDNMAKLSYNYQYGGQTIICILLNGVDTHHFVNLVM